MPLANRSIVVIRYPKDPSKGHATGLNDILAAQAGDLACFNGCSSFWSRAAFEGCRASRGVGDAVRYGERVGAGGERHLARRRIESDPLAAICVYDLGQWFGGDHSAHDEAAATGRVAQ